jgi:hypothetical protein
MANLSQARRLVVRCLLAVFTAAMPDDKPLSS